MIYHGSSGEITSPNYPDVYPENSDCVWSIIVEPSYHVEVRFVDDFDIEIQVDCLYDYVAVSLNLRR